MSDISWNSLLEQFSSLGGIAKNIVQKDAGNGRGIFIVNNQERFEVFTPSSLMIKSKDITLNEGNIIIKNKSQYSERLIKFFDDYQKNYSWGGGGRDEKDIFENNLKSLPNEVKLMLRDLKIVDIFKRHNSTWENVILREFLNSRVFNYRSSQVVVPIIELFNHDPKSNSFYKSNDGIGLLDTQINSREITFKYGFSSPLHRLFKYGFLCRESKIFSLPFRICIANTNSEIVCKGKVINSDDISLINNNHSVVFDGLPIADENVKDLPKHYWHEICRRCDLLAQEKALYQDIINFNRLSREKLMNECLENDSDFMKLIIDTLALELKLIS